MMFENFSENDILQAIKALIKEGQVPSAKCFELMKFLSLKSFSKPVGENERKVDERLSNLDTFTRLLVEKYLSHNKNGDLENVDDDNRKRLETLLNYDTATEFSSNVINDSMKDFKPILTIHLYSQRISIENCTMDFGYSGPIENLLKSIDQGILPSDYVDMFNESNNANFYEAHAIVQIHDHRVTALHGETSKIRYAILRPTMRSLIYDAQLLVEKNSKEVTDQRILEMERDLLNATLPKICLDANPYVGILNNILQFQENYWNLNMNRKHVTRAATQTEIKDESAFIPRQVSPSTTHPSKSENLIFSFLSYLERKKTARETSRPVLAMDPGKSAKIILVKGFISGISAKNKIRTLLFESQDGHRFILIEIYKSPSGRANVLIKCGTRQGHWDDQIFRTIHQNIEFSYRYISSLRKGLYSEGMLCTYDTAPQEIQARDMESFQRETSLPPALEPFELIELPTLVRQNSIKTIVPSKSTSYIPDSSSKDRAFPSEIKTNLDASLDSRRPPTDRFLSKSELPMVSTSSTINDVKLMKSSPDIISENSSTSIPSEHRMVSLRASKNLNEHKIYREVSRNQLQSMKSATSTRPSTVPSGSMSTSASLEESNIPLRTANSLPQLLSGNESIIRPNNLYSSTTSHRSSANRYHTMMSSLKAHDDSKMSMSSQYVNQVQNLQQVRPTRSSSSIESGLLPPSLSQSIGSKRVRPEDIAMAAVSRPTTKRPATSSSRKFSSSLVQPISSSMEYETYESSEAPRIYQPAHVYQTHSTVSSPPFQTHISYSQDNPSTGTTMSHSNYKRSSRGNIIHRYRGTLPRSNEISRITRFTPQRQPPT